jgi:uncharacterized protein YjiS (DUF1127 family)
MDARRQLAKLSERVGAPVSALFGLVRCRGRRNRNLSELKTLDAERLHDIGLTEAARARIVRSN